MQPEHTNTFVPNAADELIRLAHEGKRVPALLAEIEQLRNILMDTRDKLKIYYEHGNKNYEGGVPYNVLMGQITTILDT